LAALLVAYIFFYEPENTFYFTLSWLAAVAALLWVGNMWITKLLDKYFPWLKFGKKRFFTHLTTGIVYTLLIINGAYYGFKTIFTADPPILEQFIAANILGIIFFIPSFSIYFSLQFLTQWQQTELEMERFQKESMRSQLASLKNHLDPHFLFNNLNILSSLIDKDTQLSQDFLVRFAQVYRTMLLTKVEDLVTLEEEMDFIHSYIYLIKTRFENNINFNIEIPEDSYYTMLPPLTVQLLIENAVKHNIISEDRPLNININVEGNHMIIVNTLYEKPEDLKNKSGTGLKNLKDRYSYFCDEPIQFDRNAETYEVRVPLIEIETI
jgi:LytS/YehU family sensor histidine kinase